jgi:CRP/FNR family transcriptional regulator
MILSSEISKKFYYLGPDLLQAIEEFGIIQRFEPNTELVREGQYVKYIPLVISGLVKVYTQVDDKELLLYYIQPDQSCIMSFTSSLTHETSKIFARVEEKSDVLLIPADKMSKWVIEMPQINRLFYQQFDLRYTELIDTIQHLLYRKLDQRVLDYLVDKKNIIGKNTLKVSHKEIANDLGTAREVVSRILKKLETQGKIIAHHEGIEIL